MQMSEILSLFFSVGYSRRLSTVPSNRREHLHEQAGPSQLSTQQDSPANADQRPLDSLSSIACIENAVTTPLQYI